MTAKTPLLATLVACLTFGASLSVHAQSMPKNWPPKPLELTADPQVIITRAPQDASDQLYMLANDPWANEPPLEKTRLMEKSSDANIKLETNFECGYAPFFKQESANHFAINANEHEIYMFYFRLTGVEGKTVRIDIKNLNPTNMLKLIALSPVYSNDLPASASPAADTRAPFTAMTKNIEVSGVGAIALPDTSKQQWHFIENVWVDQEHKTLSFVNTFASDTVYVAMKYPYTPALNELFFAEWAKSPHAKVISTGVSARKQPLRIIRITDLAEDQQSKYPSVVIYGREHADEHDNSWACKGAIDFLLGNSPEAAAIRGKAIFHIIPLLDPDAALATSHSSLLYTFAKRTQTKESKGYAQYFQQYVDAGGRFDLVLNLHNVESTEKAYHLAVGQSEPETARLALSDAFNTMLVGSLVQQGYRASASGDTGYFPYRLSGWLDDTFGAMPILYELNSQEPHRHLLLAELTEMGATIAKTAGNFVIGENGRELHDTVQAVLEIRKAAKAAVRFNENDSVFEKEAKLKEWRARIKIY